MLPELQDSVAARIREAFVEDGLQAFDVVTEAKGDLDFLIEKRLQKAGYGLVVGTPAWQRGTEPDELAVTVTVVLTQNVVQNKHHTGTRRSATEVGELIYGILHHWRPDDSWSELIFSEWSLGEVEPNSQIVLYIGSFQTSTITQITH